jgi:hypothetical protein
LIELGIMQHTLNQDQLFGTTHKNTGKSKGNVEMDSLIAQASCAEQNGGDTDV